MRDTLHRRLFYLSVTCPHLLSVFAPKLTRNKADVIGSWQQGQRSEPRWLVQSQLVSVDLPR